jgi:hypothetical protein
MHYPEYQKPFTSPQIQYIPPQLLHQNNFYAGRNNASSRTIMSFTSV